MVSPTSTMKAIVVHVLASAFTSFLSAAEKGSVTQLKDTYLCFEHKQKELDTLDLVNIA